MGTLKPGMLVVLHGWDDPRDVPSVIETSIVSPLSISIGGPLTIKSLHTRKSELCKLVHLAQSNTSFYAYTHSCTTLANLGPVTGDQILRHTSC